MPRRPWTAAGVWGRQCHADHAELVSRVRPSCCCCLLNHTTTLTTSYPCSTAMGIKCKDGVVLVGWLRGRVGCCGKRAASPHPPHHSLLLLPTHSPLQQAVEKLIVSKLLVEGSNRRIYNVDHHAGMVSGLMAPEACGWQCGWQCGMLPLLTALLPALPAMLHARTRTHNRLWRACCRTAGKSSTGHTTRRRSTSREWLYNLGPRAAAAASGVQPRRLSVSGSSRPT
jgi:hypothetical protein